MSAKLMVHCGGREVARGELAGVGIPAPTATWQPIPHAELVDEVESALSRNGLRVTGEQHALARDGDRYFGLLQVANGKGPEDHAWILGLRNSHDQSFPAGLVVGSRVLVCDNLAFSGEIVLARKHTRHIRRDLPRLVMDGVGQLGGRWHSQEERYGRYRETALCDAQAHDLVVRTLDAGVVTATQVPEVLREWRRPEHPQFEQRSVWALFNSVTHALRGSSVWLVSRRTQALHGVFDAHCGLAGSGATSMEQPARQPALAA